MASSITPLLSISFPISHLLTINVSNFVSSKLGGDKISNNYSTWKEQMLCLIDSQDLRQFINGEIQPRNVEDDVIQRIDRLVMGWILGALDEAVLQTVPDLTTATASDVWLRLERIFKDPEGDPLQQAAEGEWDDRISLYKAALAGDWSKAKAILDRHPNAMKAQLNPSLQTALHVAVGNGKADHRFVKELVDYMPDDLLGLPDYLGFTALHVAADTENIDAAKILVGRRPDLLSVANKAGAFPVHMAVLSRKRTTIEYFIFQTQDETPYLNETSGIKLLCMLIDAEIFDIALYLAEKYPKLATVRLEDGDSALKRIALQTNAFPAEPILRWFYGFGRKDRTKGKTGDIEGSILTKRTNRDSSTGHKPFYEPFRFMVYTLVSVLYYSGWRYVDPLPAKHRYDEAVKLVKCLCKNMESLHYNKASVIYGDAILTAARLGIDEIIKEIATVFPPAVYARDTHTNKSIFHEAAESRHMGVFNLISKRGNIKHQMSDMTDACGNTVLHSAAKSGSYYTALKYRSGAALQIQSEIQWFTDIEKRIQPDAWEKVNDAGKTAWDVFVEQHAVLKGQVENWEKDTSQACSIVAGLIATVTFAAAITMPGNLNEKTHLPVFSHTLRFKAFIWCSIVSFSTSITCLFLFLSTNISLYSDKILLPVKTILNLFFLFVSAMCMMGAFISAIYLILEDRNTTIVFSILLLYVSIPCYFFLVDYIPLVWTLQIYFKDTKRK